MKRQAGRRMGAGRGDPEALGGREPGPRQGPLCQAEERDGTEPPGERRLSPTAPATRPGPGQPRLSFSGFHPSFCRKPPAATGHGHRCSRRVLYLVPRSGRRRPCPLCVCFQSRLPAACLLVLPKQPHGGVTNIRRTAHVSSVQFGNSGCVCVCP